MALEVGAERTDEFLVEGRLMTDVGGTIGVLALLPINLRRVFLPEQKRLIDTFIAQIVQGLGRVRLHFVRKLIGRNSGSQLVLIGSRRMMPVVHAA